MKRYMCSKCGYIEECENMSQDFICPKCGALSNSFNLYEEQLAESEIDAIINSVIEDAYEIKNSKIINNNEDQKSLVIGNNNYVVEKKEDKCINCGQCKKICENVANLTYNLNYCKEPICIGCGKCINICPSKALNIKSNIKEIKEIIDLNEKIVIAILSQSTIASFKEKYGKDEGINIEKKLISSLKKIGFDFVFDESYGSDLLVLEETAELIERLRSKSKLPLITSRCPSARKYIEIYHPDLINNLSTCKSDSNMISSVIKNYFCKEKGFDPLKIVNVLISTCPAKKMEIKEYETDLDYVLSTQELEQLIQDENIKIEILDDKEYDEVISESSSCGSLFQNIGGQTESVIRTLYRIMSRKNIVIDSEIFQSIRQTNGISENALLINKNKIKVAVVEKMENLEKILRNDYYKNFHYIELMNCENGCIGGSENLIIENSQNENNIIRKNIIFNQDLNKETKCAHDNKMIKKLYSNYYKKPLSEIGLSELHSGFHDKNYLLNDKQN